MDRAEILQWLTEGDRERLEGLWRRADRVRREHVGDEVHLRGLIETSNICARNCWYCGLRAANRSLARYRMTEDEIMWSAARAVHYGYGTVVLQSGEDYGLSAGWLAAVIRRIKSETHLAVTLSMGERPDEDLAAWREAGADRYLLRFETSDRELYDRIHPPLPGRRSDRFATIATLNELGYESGSGVMVGIPGQTHESLAADIRAFAELQLDMIGLGPYLPHPETPLVRNAGRLRAPEGQQVANSEVMTCTVLALTRIACPETNIPSTTALATLNKSDGRRMGLACGANVIMPNLTPLAYRPLYEIYPSKAGAFVSDSEYHHEIRRQILAMGRTVGTGRGDSIKHLREVSAFTANR